MSHKEKCTNVRQKMLKRLIPYECMGMFEMRRRWCRVIVCGALGIGLFGILYFGVFCPDHVCALTNGSPTPPYKPSSVQGYVINREIQHQNFEDSSLDRDYEFDIEGEDVLVFLHIQKTGGTTFGRHLVKNLDIDPPCRCFRGRKRCDCHTDERHIWLFSRFSTGWVCGLHADWTELKECVSDTLDRKEGDRRRRRYLYITIIRDPLHRYLSEWKHVQRGATWMGAKLKCNGRSATLQEVPFCYSGEDWSGVAIDNFIDCPHNLANNRQTRMLANLSLINCYNSTTLTTEKRQQMMLQSAKDNLKDMAFFGLTEFQKDTQYMFERTFKLKFIEDFEQRNATHASKLDVNKDQVQKILEINKLDVELYDYAKDLFFQRLKRLKEEEGTVQSNVISRTSRSHNQLEKEYIDS